MPTRDRPARFDDASVQDSRVGIWDQWCVLSNRYYNKAGELSLLDEKNCRQIIENFARQKDNLSCNIGHKPENVAAHYNAMALFVGGACVAFATHDPEVQPPQLEQLPGGDDGSPPDDGIYWCRAELEDLGHLTVRTHRKVSPEFFSAAKNSYGEEIGYQAIGGAWTNYPFLDGCEKHAFERDMQPTQFTRRAPMPKKSFAQRQYEDAGVDDKEDPANRMAKLRAYWRGKHGGATGFAKMEQEAGADEKDPEGYTRAMMSFMVGRFGHAEPDGDEGKGGKGGQAMEDPVVVAGAPTQIKEPATSKDQVAGGGTSMSRDGFAQFARQVGLPEDPAAARAKVDSLAAAAGRLPELNRQVEQLFSRDKEREAAGKALEAVASAWDEGRIVPRQDEDERAAQERHLQLFTKHGEGAFAAALSSPKSYTPRAHMMDRLTSGGLSLGAKAPARQQEYSRPDEGLVQLAEKRMQEYEKAGRKVSRLDAAREVALENPDITAEYGEQSALATLEPLLNRLSRMGGGARA